MSKRDIGKEILAGLEEIAAWKKGERTLKTTRVELPQAADVPAIRARLGLSQEAFAACMGVSVGTLRNWEQGRREPQGPARALLLIADRKPRAFLEAVQLARRARCAAWGGYMSIRGADWKATVEARTRRDPEFRDALLCEGVNAQLSGDVAAGPPGSPPEPLVLAHSGAECARPTPSDLYCPRRLPYAHRDRHAR